jgi:hypothetical protein
MIHVFKTSVRSKKQTKQVGFCLGKLGMVEKWNFDLKDCDKILRVETQSLESEVISEMPQSVCYKCKELL